MRRFLFCLLISMANLLARASEPPPDPSIAFLLQRQEADGCWNDRTHHLIPPLLPEDHDGSTRSAVFTTGLVIRALVTGDHHPQQDQAVLTALQRGTDYLCRLQQDTGEISDNVGDHGVATHALRLVHAAGMLPQIGPKVQRAMEYLRAKQRVRYGWSENDRDPQRIDLWVGFWCLQVFDDREDTKPSSPQLLSGWWDLIAKGASKERPDGGFPASFIVSPDGSWSHDPTTPDGSVAALFNADHPLVHADHLFVVAMRKRMSASMMQPDRDANIDWPRRLALSMTLTFDQRKAAPWAALFSEERSKDGPTAGSWPATGSTIGRISATACALIVRRQFNEKRVTDQVPQALSFFQRHANADGGWSDHLANGEAQSSSISTTALVVLSFLGAGYDHKSPTRYKKTVEAGIEYLRKIRDLDRLSTLEFAMVTTTLVEAYAMTNDPQLRTVGTQHLLALLSRRTDLPGVETLAGAWSADHLNPGFQHDTWTTMWCMMAMKSGVAGGLPIGDGVARTGRWFDHVINRRVPGDPLRFPAQCRWDATGLCQIDGRAEAAALWIALITAHKPDEPAFQDLVNAVATSELPQWRNQNYDLGYAYVTMLGLFQAGGPAWATTRRRWPGSMPTMDISEALAGSISEGQRANGAVLGRITATAYFTLTNEVMYRYQATGPRD